MAEHSKSWFLKELINLNAFAVSASELAMNIGYRGKSQIYRILNDTAGDVSINAIWNRICKTYHLTDDELCEYINVIGTAKDLWKQVQGKASSLAVDVQELAENTLHALLLCDQKGMRRVLNLADWECLLDFSREHPLQYAQLIVVYYTLYNNIEQAFHGELAEVGIDLLDALYRQMHRLQPENTMLTEMADAYRSELSQASVTGNLWTIILRPTLLVQSFTDRDYRINSLSQLRLLPIPTDSLWLEHETISRKAGPAFIFFEVEPDGATGGRYDCIEVDAVTDNAQLRPRRFFSFCMMKPEASQSGSLAFIQFKDMDGRKQVVRYRYDYDAERHNLHLAPCDADSPNCITFPFPMELHWVDDKHRMTQEEGPWIDWYNGFMEANEEQVLAEMLKFEGVTLMEDYEVIDVAISRRYLAVTIGHGEEEMEYKVELDKHPGLRRVEPQMDAAIFRHDDDQQLYLEWISPHISIPLKALTKQ